MICQTTYSGPKIIYFNWPYSSPFGNGRLTATGRLICGNENVLYGFFSPAGYVQQSKDVLNIVLNI